MKTKESSEDDVKILSHYICLLSRIITDISEGYSVPDDHLIMMYNEYTSKSPTVSDNFNHLLKLLDQHELDHDCSKI